MLDSNLADIYFSSAALIAHFKLSLHLSSLQVVYLTHTFPLIFNVLFYFYCCCLNYLNRMSFICIITGNTVYLSHTSHTSSEV